MNTYVSHNLWGLQRKHTHIHTINICKWMKRGWLIYLGLKVVLAAGGLCCFLTQLLESLFPTKHATHILKSNVIFLLFWRHHSIVHRSLIHTVITGKKKETKERIIINSRIKKRRMTYKHINTHSSHQPMHILYLLSICIIYA